MFDKQSWQFAIFVALVAFVAFVAVVAIVFIRHGSNGLDSVSARQPSFPRMSERSKALSQEQADSLERLTNQ